VNFAAEKRRCQRTAGQRKQTTGKDI